MMKYESVENTETVQGREKHAPFPLNISPIVIIHTVLPRVLQQSTHEVSQLRKGFNIKGIGRDG